MIRKTIVKQSCTQYMDHNFEAPTFGKQEQTFSLAKASGRKLAVKQDVKKSNTNLES